jgi:hypothetical protein
MALVEIALFNSRPEAEIAAGALRAGGFTAVTFDDGIGGAAYNTGLSGPTGYRLLGLDAEKEDALAFLRQLQTGAQQTE